MVKFDGSVFGMALNLLEANVGVVIFGNEGLWLRVRKYIVLIN